MPSVLCVKKQKEQTRRGRWRGNTPKSCLMADMTSELALKYQVAAECVKQILTIWCFTIYTELIEPLFGISWASHADLALGGLPVDLNVAEAWELGYTGKRCYPVELWTWWWVFWRLHSSGTKCVFCMSLERKRSIVREMLVRGRRARGWAWSCILWRHPHPPHISDPQALHKYV